MSDVETLPRLAPDLLDRLGSKAPAYDRSRLEPRILHIGPGAFFRAHQADYVDRLNATDPVWGITAVSMRSTSVADALGPQAGLYTLVTLDREVSARVIGALTGVHHASEPAALEAFRAPELRLVTLTITEKGYCLAGDGSLDETHPDIQADLADPDRPVSAIGWIVRGLAARYRAGLAAPIILSCDNLPGNGEKLGAAVLGLARMQDTPLAEWIEEHCLFPSSMVDSITPATDEALKARVEEMLGIADAWPIQREAFTDWVIEETGDPRMPPFDQSGAVFTDDVAAFEQAKLRMLNGPHSALAYYGLACGFESVSEAMNDPHVSRFMGEKIWPEIGPSLERFRNVNPDRYQNELTERFRNPAIVHKLSQIAWDGSKKLPIRLLATIEDNLAADRSIEALSTAVAAWWRFVIRMTRAGETITDPLAAKLAAMAMETRDDAGTDIPIMLSLDEIFPQTLAGSDAFRAALTRGYNAVIKAEKMNKGGQ